MPYKQQFNSHYFYPYNRDGKWESLNVNTKTNINWFKTNFLNIAGLPVYAANKENYPDSTG